MVLGGNLKNNRMILVCFQVKSFSLTVIKVYPTTTNAKKDEVKWCHTYRPSRANTKERSPSHQRGLECKGRKSRNTWNNRQIWPWSKEWRLLPRESTGHSKHPLPTTQEKTLHMDITGWSITKSDWLYFLQSKTEKLYAVSKNKTWSWLWLRSWTSFCQIRT